MQQQPIRVLETFAERFLTWRGTWAAALEARKASSARCSASSSCWSSSRWSTRPPWSPPWPTTPWGRPCRRSGCSCCSSCSPSPASRSPASARPTSSSSSTASHQPLWSLLELRSFWSGVEHRLTETARLCQRCVPGAGSWGSAGLTCATTSKRPRAQHTTLDQLQTSFLLTAPQLAGCLLVACGLNGERERGRESWWPSCWFLATSQNNNFRPRSQPLSETARTGTTRKSSRAERQKLVHLNMHQVLTDSSRCQGPFTIWYINVSREVALTAWLDSLLSTTQLIKSC